MEETGSILEAFLYYCREISWFLTHIPEGTLGVIIIAAALVAAALCFMAWDLPEMREENAE